MIRTAIATAALGTAVLVGSATAANAATFVIQPLGTAPVAGSRTLTFDGTDRRRENGIFAVGGSVYENSQPGVGTSVNGTNFLGTHIFNVGTGSASVYSSVGDFLSVSFDWGTPDGYNRLALLDRNGATIQAFNGSDLGFGNGTTNESRRVTFNTVAGENAINGIRFFSSSPAFEVDNISFAVAAVPEPATWAMMVLGFGVVGFGMRRRKSVKTTVQFA